MLNVPAGGGGRGASRLCECVGEGTAVLNLARRVVHAYYSIIQVHYVEFLLADFVCKEHGICSVGISKL